MNRVIFDLDGTLLDLDVDIEATRSRIAGWFGQRGYHGSFSPILPAIDEAARAIATSAAQYQTYCAQARGFLDDGEVLAAAETRARPHARECIEALQHRRVPMAIVTDNGRACISPALASAGLPPIDAGWCAVVTRDDVAQSKPHPSGLARALASMPEASGVTWFIGDSARDVCAARAYGAPLRVAIVLGGRGDPTSLSDADPDALLPDLSHLHTLEGFRHG